MNGTVYQVLIMSQTPVTTCAEAHAVLERLLPAHNRRFSKPARRTSDAHRSPVACPASDVAASVNHNCPVLGGMRYPDNQVSRYGNTNQSEDWKSGPDELVGEEPIVMQFNVENR